MFYRSFSSEMRRRFGSKVYKLALDGGMTCPNRDGTLDTRGCIFCSGGSGGFASPNAGDIDAQIAAAKARVSFKAGKSCKYIAYFQSYTNTYAPLDRLRELFFPLAEREDIAAVSIATRPDCLGEDVLELLSEINEKKPVWVELGLQTIHEKTAEYIRRGYSLPVFDSAAKRLKARGLEFIVHLILGLPGESDEMIYSSAEYVSKSGANGVKLQLLHILAGTDLAAEYLAGRVEALSLERYTELLEGCVRRLNPDIVIHRLTGDGAKRELIAPMWSADKKRVLNAVLAAFERDNVIQGSLDI